MPAERRRPWGSAEGLTSPASGLQSYQNNLTMRPLYQHICGSNPFGASGPGCAAANLYHSALRGKTGTRWLDVGALVSSILPSATINKIKYFTAKVSARAWDLNQPVRQQTYLRALQTLSNVEPLCLRPEPISGKKART